MYRLTNPRYECDVAEVGKDAYHIRVTCWHDGCPARHMAWTDNPVSLDASRFAIAQLQFRVANETQIAHERLEAAYAAPNA